MNKPGSEVFVLPLTRAQATEIVRDVVKDGRWSVIVDYDKSHEWRRIVNRRQIEQCLVDGYVLDERAKIDEHDNWRFSMGRVCAGLNVVIEVALERVMTMPQLFVIGIKGDQI